MDVPRLLRKLEESGLPMGLFAGVPPQLKQLWIKQTKTIVQMEHKAPADHPCQKDAEFKRNIKVCKELLRELDVAEEDWYVEEHEPKIDQPTPERNVELAGAQMEELHIAQETRQPRNAASEMTPQKREKVKAQPPQKRAEVVKNSRPPPTPKGVLKEQRPPITPKTPREAEVRTPRIVNTPKGTSSKSRDNTPARLLRSAKATAKTLEFDGSMEKNTSQDRAERQREEFLQGKAERVKRAREEREEAVKARRMQMEKERVARLEAKIREKSPAKSMADQFKQIRQRLQKSPASPRVAVKKALLQDKHVPVFVTQATSENRSAPKRKSRREEEMETDAHVKPLVQHVKPSAVEEPLLQDLKSPKVEEPLMQDVSPQAETEEPTTYSDTRNSNHFVFDEPMPSKERTSSKVSNAQQGQEPDKEDTRNSNHFVFDEPMSSKERTSSKVSSNAQQSQELDEENALPTNEISKAQEEPVKEIAPTQIEAKVLVESSKPNKIIEEPTVDKDADYGIDDLHSGDDTDDEENPRKEIPAWARGSALIRAVRTQASLRYNIDEYFGAKQEVDLQSIFGPKRFKPRSSSAVWHSPIHRPRPGFSTLDSSVVAEQVDEE